MLRLTPNEDVRFIKYYWQHKKNSIVTTFLQGGQGNLSGTIVKKVVILLPIMKEQRKIAYFFKSIDQKIEKEKEKLEALQ